MILVDTNTLIIIVLGLINPKLVNTHKKTSLFNEEDFYSVMDWIGDVNNLIILPNIFTEVDNLLNRFTGKYRQKYIDVMATISCQIKEEYLPSVLGIKDYNFATLGLTDVLIIQLKDKYKTLITADSDLSDWANASGIDVLDLKELKNYKLTV